MNSMTSTPAIDKITVGLCGECGGNVTIPQMWSGSQPPTPTCERCWAVAIPDKPVLRVLQMQPRNLCANAQSLPPADTTEKR